MTNERLAKILLQEIADVRLELKGDFHLLRGDVTSLRNDVSVLKNDVSILKNGMSGLKRDFSVLRTEVHQNQISFITNHDDHEKRITRIEAKIS